MIQTAKIEECDLSIYRDIIACKLTIKTENKDYQVLLSIDDKILAFIMSETETKWACDLPKKSIDVIIVKNELVGFSGKNEKSIRFSA